ncbi:hypothetical protein UFOVP204_169 [uncultured Caudovirales phage]|uniref:Uncharacterized protein n=1 Tax=uncultured Caudovirales phage TaxID=2100421 RepID=A0A6J7WKQ2_9CAUD|nr:hypothetical protein UFOVP204_169 [uncultured Caudovirales phage]
MAYTNFKIIQGDRWSLTLTYTDVNDVPINIEEYNLIAEVTDKPGGSIICATTTTQSGGIVTVDDGYGATVMVTFTGDQTKKFILPKSYYQIKIVDTEDTLLNGWVELEASTL